MDWDDAVERAKRQVGTNDWDYMVETAHRIISNYHRNKHKKYLESQEWKEKRKRILKRDKEICQDCLKVIPEVIKEFEKFYNQLNKQDVYTWASQVHHLDYSYLNTLKEEDYCISLCDDCHKLRHSTLSIDRNFLIKKRYEKIYKRLWRFLLTTPFFKKINLRLYDEGIKRITIKPEELIEEMKKKNGDKRRS